MALAAVSLMQLKNLPNVKISFGDKIFHFIVYAILTVLWFNAFNYKFKLDRMRAIVYAALFSTLFGIILEVLQGSATTYRSFDLYDAIANTLGACFAMLILIATYRIQVKK